MRLAFLLTVFLPSLAFAIPNGFIIDSDSSHYRQKPPCEAWLSADGAALKVNPAALELPGIKLNAKEKQNVQAKLEFFAKIVEAKLNHRPTLDVSGEAMNIEGRRLLKIVSTLSKESSESLKNNPKHERAKNVNNHLATWKRDLSERLKSNTDLSMRELVTYCFLTAAAKESIGSNYNSRKQETIDNYGLDIADLSAIDLTGLREGKAEGEVAMLWGFLRSAGEFEGTLQWPSVSKMSQKEKLALGFLPFLDHAWHLDSPTQSYRGIATAWDGQDSTQSFRSNLFQDNSTTATVAQALNRSYSIWAHMLAAAVNEADIKLIYKLRYDAIVDGTSIEIGRRDVEVVLDWTNPATLTNFLFRQYTNEYVQDSNEKSIREADRALGLLSNYPGWLEGTSESLRKVLQKFPNEAVSMRKVFLDSMTDGDSSEKEEGGGPYIGYMRPIF